MTNSSCTFLYDKHFDNPVEIELTNLSLNVTKLWEFKVVCQTEKVFNIPLLSEDIKQANNEEYTTYVLASQTG